MVSPSTHFDGSTFREHLSAYQEYTTATDGCRKIQPSIETLTTQLSIIVTSLKCDQKPFTEARLEL
jgi:hypothetical protein